MNPANDREFSLSQIFKNYNAIKKNKAQIKKIKVFSEVTFQPNDIITDYFARKFGFSLHYEIGLYDQMNYETHKVEENKINEYDFIYIHSSIFKWFISNEVNLYDENTTRLDIFLENVKKICKKNSKTSVIVNTLEYPPFRIRGSLSSRSGLTFRVREFNNALFKLSYEVSNLIVQDINYISSRTGLDEWFDYDSWVAFKQPFSEKGLVALSQSLASVIASAIGKTKKIIISDLDDTIWSGIVGDDGIDGILIGPNTPKGELFYIIQKYLLFLIKSGVIFSIASKNDNQVVSDAFKKRKEDMPINLELSSSSKINWTEKSKNIKEILLELNLLSDSAIFIDDSELECLEVETNTDGCIAISYKKSPIELIKKIDSMGFFEITNISSSDKSRTQYYKDNKIREKLIENSDSYEKFLKSLEMKTNIQWKVDKHIERASQLTKKTNQFNLTQVSIEKEDVKSYEANDNKWIVISDLIDKIGNNGIVTVAFGFCKDDKLIIENWTMSCRVFNRGLDFALLNEILAFAKSKGLQEIHSSINKIQKNKFTHNLHELLGFKLMGKSDNKYNYVYDLKNFLDNKDNESQRGHYIKVCK